MLRVAGAGLLTAAGAIHLDLYLTGYRTIPVIGWLFLLQVIAAFGLALAVLAIGDRPGIVGGLAAAAGAGFALATLGGYLLSVWTGLFGFREVRTTAGVAAGVIDVAAFAVLATLALAPARAGRPGRRRGSGPGQVPRPDSPGDRPGGSNDRGDPDGRGAGAARSRSSRGQSSRAGRHEHGPEEHHDRRADGADQRPGPHPLLVRPGHPDQSKCYGSCAAYWPPATGTAAASPGLPGRIGTITRTGGARQLTYNGHPLYTYIADTAPGQAKGNNLNLNGGLWHDVPISR